jgi:hypothetical protein
MLDAPARVVERKELPFVKPLGGVDGSDDGWIRCSLATNEASAASGDRRSRRPRRGRAFARRGSAYDRGVMQPGGSVVQAAEGTARIEPSLVLIPQRGNLRAWRRFVSGTSNGTTRRRA